jgi:hypothetical protein
MRRYNAEEMVKVIGESRVHTHLAGHLDWLKETSHAA